MQHTDYVSVLAFMTKKVASATLRKQIQIQDIICEYLIGCNLIKKIIFMGKLKVRTISRY